MASYLRDAILGGQLQPGDRIRQEEVAERFGASRLPVREALRMLEAEGLTELEPHKGARVPRLTQHEVEVIYQMRERLEPLALAESLPRLTAADDERLGQVQQRIEDNDDLEQFLDLDREFHMLTYGGCPVEPLNSAVARLWNSTQHYRRSYVTLGGQDRMWLVNAEHRLILDASAAARRHRRGALPAGPYPANPHRAEPPSGGVYVTIPMSTQRPTAARRARAHGC